MRHRRAGVHLSRPTAHRKALFSNLVAALLTNERIRTTDAKAKETRRLAERTITWARRLGDILVKKADRRSPDESARVVHAVRMARRIVRDRSAVSKLFNEIGPRFLTRQGGYTRIVKIGQRPGDAAPMSLLELIPDAASQADTQATSDRATKSEKGTAKGTKADKAQARKASPASGGAKQTSAGRAKPSSAPKGQKGEGAKAPPAKKSRSK